MAVAVAVLLLGLARAAGGCLHCAPAALEALEQLRAALVPRRFTAPGPQSRAEALLVGMQGSFFRDYALDAFVGKVGLDELDAVASFTKNQTKTLRATVLQDGPLLEELVAFRRRVTEELKKALKDYEERACDATACHTLEGDVLDCFLCQNVRPQCIAYEECFGVLRGRPVPMWEPLREMIIT
ncbi:izumo sperm-egg fusion protein 2 isoform X3 [Dasypus novemcinctus]|uniref:izumo sperm-egg fusion protein 2 isoform X3 n=1 Tax=Dasypus novemcinctus TaxID=9361 RepID=UPI0039C98B10